MGRRRTEVFLRESVVLFGFLNGLWLAIGVNPGAELLHLLRDVVENLFGAGGAVGLVFTVLPLALLGVAFYLIHKRGGWLGFVAVGLAFIAGMSVLAQPRTGLVLMLAAVALGVLASR